MSGDYYIYLLSNKRRNVLYTGITNNLVRRVYEHKTGQSKGFTKKYNVCDLVYYEAYNRAYDAIKREKQLKGSRRSKKDRLINEHNPEWNDLSEQFYTNEYEL